MAEWKLFDGRLPEPPEYLRDREWMSLDTQPGFAQRSHMVTCLVRFVHKVRPLSSITDLGCGDGSLLAQLCSLGIPMWGYELGRGDVLAGRHWGRDVRQGDIVADNDLEYGELLIASEVVEHIEEPESFLRGLPGRLLIVSSPSAETGDWHNSIHAWAWDTEGYAALVNRAGWDVAYHTECDGGMNCFGGVEGTQRFQAIVAVRLADSLRMGTALITGSAGFVGRHFVKKLRDEGWKVRCVDVEDPENPEDARTFFRYDSGTYDLVIHCAAVVGGRQVIDGNPLAQAVNLELDAAMFQWALRTRPGRVVYFSSSAAYPVGLQELRDRRRLKEDHISWGPEKDIGKPDQLYGWAKLTGELLARKAMDQGQAVSIVRPFSGYGEDQEDCYPFPAFIDRSLRHEDPFAIWGSGEQVRDFVHIDDIVRAVLVMVDQEVNGPLNLCTGQPTSMKKLAQMVCIAAGYSPEFETMSSAPSGVGFRVGDPYYQNRIYTLRVSLEDGIKRALKYRKKLHRLS